MRALAAASSCLSVVISAAAAAVRSTIIASISRGRADRALPPSGLLKIFGDIAGVPSRLLSPCRRGPAGRDRLYQGATPLDNGATCHQLVKGRLTTAVGIAPCCLSLEARRAAASRSGTRSVLGLAAVKQFFAPAIRKQLLRSGDDGQGLHDRAARR